MAEQNNTQKVWVNIYRSWVMTDKKSNDPIVVDTHKLDRNGEEITAYKVKLPKGTMVDGQDVGGFTFLARYLAEPTKMTYGISFNPGMNINLSKPVKEGDAWSYERKTISVEQLAAATAPKVNEEIENRGRFIVEQMIKKDPNAYFYADVRDNENGLVARRLFCSVRAKVDRYNPLPPDELFYSGVTLEAMKEHIGAGTSPSKEWTPVRVDEKGFNPLIDEQPDLNIEAPIAQAPVEEEQHRSPSTAEELGAMASANAPSASAPEAAISREA